ncbi:DUF3427 domain-containing protein [Solitalea longa]|uniref:DUF3427 domain-containing protein n=1 Tax=Solitalea longa TaxID=2079460 RepID=A0A2S4ZWH7_9SPHI|nr:DEAD/DEAH box helicase [Solitalea longa]POY34721.1 DUF3427 domain-containing protein [Solitalea longa]
MLELGIYEQLINKILWKKIESLSRDEFYISETKIDKEEAARYLSVYLSESIRFALNSYTGDDKVEKQVELCNKVIQLLRTELNNIDFENDLLHTEGKVLQAVFSKVDASFSDFELFLKQITPYSRLSQSELFTGSNVGLSLESEIKKEILSADEIRWLVSFIKFSGIRIFEKELRSFTESGKKLRIITTSYMGATDVKAIEFLSSLPNTEIKVSYNSEHERLHAKAYLFLRNTGFNTGYIGSSNISRSALTNGLEWNLKVTSKEISHIIDKFKRTFDTYWLDNDFEYYRNGEDVKKLDNALKAQKSQDRKTILSFFDLKPFPYQEEILEKLKAERLTHNHFRNLVVAATGTGKTIISAFDYKRFKDENSSAKLLFVTHRKEILEQAQQAFQHILKDNNFGELWVAGLAPTNYDFVFASVQTLNNQLKSLSLSEDYYDFIIIDEVHHIAANSYRPLLEKFKPKVLLGLTATPERMDGEDILRDFCNTIAAEIRLPEALNRKLLCPFQYFGLPDSVDLSKVSWRNGKYDVSELTHLYTESDRRVAEVIKNLDKYLTDIHNPKALGFCISQEHAKYMAEKFVLAGFKADYLTSDNSDDRDIIREKFKSSTINYLFVVDIFNEGVDIPEIDTVLFLRPTESLTIFLQQLGRGLRLSKDKECLTVLDFVGNARAEYDFEHKFRALIGKTHTSIQKEIESDFPHLPLGCSIVLEKKAKEYILANIKQAIGFNRTQLIAKIRNFKHQSTLPLTLNNFLNFYHLDLPLIYRKDSWKRLCADAGIINDFNEPNEKELFRTISKKLLQCNSTSYLNFVLRVIESSIDFDLLSEEEKKMALMLHYDIWQESGPKMGFKDLKESLSTLMLSSILIEELKEFIQLQLSKVDFIEKEIELDFVQPLKVHSRYNRDQILSAFGLHTFQKQASNREGVAFISDINTEILFVTLKKSEKDYSPTTLYDDYAITDTLFHWQSQNSTSPNSPKGQSYIYHKELKKNVLLFVREQNDDEYGFTMSYVFLGKVDFLNYQGAKPMSIEWKLEEPMPAYLWKDSAKMAVG